MEGRHNIFNKTMPFYVYSSFHVDESKKDG